MSVLERAPAAGATETMATSDAAAQVGPWDLSQLLASEDEGSLRRAQEEIEAAVGAVEAARPILDEPGFDAGRLAGVLDRWERAVEALSILGGYASLRFAADTQSPQALALRNRVERLLTEAENRLLFLSLWWKALPEERAAALAAGIESADRRHLLADLRRLQPFTLEEKSEQIINLKDADGMAGLLTAYSIVTHRLEFEFEKDGARRQMTRDELMSHVHSTRPAEREAAYRELYRVYGRETALLGQIYVHRVRDWHNENVLLRRHASPIAVRHAMNDVPGEAVEALLETARAERGVFQRYFRFKAGRLGTPDRLRRYDLYAPVGHSEKTVEWRRAVALVLEVFHGFHPRLGEAAASVFAERHVDSEVRRGKKGGAFCATLVPRLAPWVLVNYTGRVRDVATLAHELGHAVHSILARGHDVFTQHPSLPLAETASVFGEILVTDRLLAEETDAAARRDLLVAALDDMYATVLRQAYFTLFEVEAHQAVLAGRSVEDLSALYLERLREQFGAAVEVPDEFALEWTTIPHLYQTPFYCYAYSFGQLLVLSLYRRFREEGRAFVPGYLRLLERGGSRRPVEVLGEIGIDPTDPAFWRGGFAVIADFVDELEALDAAAAPPPVSRP